MSKAPARWRGRTGYVPSAGSRTAGQKRGRRTGCLGQGIRDSLDPILFVAYYLTSVFIGLTSQSE